MACSEITFLLNEAFIRTLRLTLHNKLSYYNAHSLMPKINTYYKTYEDKQKLIKLVNTFHCEKNIYILLFINGLWIFQLAAFITETKTSESLGDVKYKANTLGNFSICE